MDTLYTVLSWLIAIVLGWSILSAFYWCFARRVLHNAILFRIFKKRDELRSMAIDKKVDPNSFAYRFLEHRLCQQVYVSPELTIVNFVRFYYSDDANKSSPELDQFLSDAPEPLQELWRHAIGDVKLMLLANSPIISFIAIVVVLAQGLQESITAPVFRFFEREVVAEDARLLAT